MAQYIDKAALVAEIEKLQLCTMDEHMNYYSAEAQGEYNALSKLESFLDTLEVKEVNLEKELDKFYGMYRKSGQTFSLEDNQECLDWKVDCNPKFEKAFAKHFFNLGLKHRKENSMTGKVQKIRSYLADMANADGAVTVVAKAIRKEILPYIDSLQEEPVSEELNTESMIESYKQRLISQANGLGSPLIDMCLVSYKHGINETLDTLNLSNVLRNVKNLKEPVSEDLEEAAIQFATDTKTGKVDVVKQSSFFWGAIYHKQQMMAKAFDFTKEHNTACVLASECLRGNGWFSKERDFNDLFRHLSCVDKLFEGKFSGKTKVIVIKED